MRRSLPLLASLAGAALLSAREAAAVQAAAVQAAPEAADHAPMSRAERLAADRARLAADLAAVEAFGHDDAFCAALQDVRAKANGEKWWPVADGKVSLVTVEHWLDWNRPAAGRALPAALDLELPGHPFTALADLSRQLHDHGIEFLYVSFPTRLQLDPALVVPGLATPRAAAAGAAEGADGAVEGTPLFRGMVAAQTRFLQALNEAGVEVLDLAPEFAALHDAGEDDPRRRFLYHRFNMHWTPRAIELAAQRTAERLAQMEWWKPGPYQEGKAFAVRRRVFEFMAEGNGHAPDATPEPIAVNSIAPLGPPLQKEAKQRGPIVLLGDSFADFHKEYSAAFHDQLFRFTGWPIDAIVPAGGAELQCREKLRRRGDGLAGKKVVIWLMQEAALVVSPQWKPVALFE